MARGERNRTVNQCTAFSGHLHSVFVIDITYDVTDSVVLPLVIDKSGGTCSTSSCPININHCVQMGGP